MARHARRPEVKCKERSVSGVTTSLGMVLYPEVELHSVFVGESVGEDFNGWAADWSTGEDSRTSQLFCGAGLLI